MRLDIPAGTAVRFEPGDEKAVTLVELGGAREVYGLNALADGPRRRRQRRGRCARAAAQRLPGSGLDEPADRRGGSTPISTARPPATASGSPTPTCSSRSSTTSPSTATRSKFGGGKVIRDGMGQSARATARRRRARPRHHQRADPRPLGHRQGRHRHPRRPHRRRSARRATRTSWTASRRAWSIGAGDRGHRRRGQHRHRRRHRHAHPLHLPAARSTRRSPPGSPR